MFIEMRNIRNTAALVCCLILFLSAFSGIGTAAEEKVLVIKAGHVLPISRAEILDGMIIVSGEKIVAVGRNLDIPEGAEVMELGECWVMPGLIESHTSFAMGDRYSRPDTDETSNPNTAHLNILDGLNPFQKTILYTARAGVTASMVTPGRQNVIGGQTAVVKHRGRTVDEMSLLSPAGMKFSLGEGPKETYGSKGRLPSTRMGSAYVVRKALLDAGDFLAKRKKVETKAKDKENGGNAGGRDLNLEALADVLDGKMTAFFECYRADDIMTALRLIDEFKLKAVLVGVTEGYKLADEIASRKIPVILSPIGVGPRRMETQEATYMNASRLDRAGITVIVKADEALGMGQLRELPLMASFAVKGGMDRNKALRAITLTAAEVLGVSGRIGSLEAGKDADIVVFSGDPLHYKTRVIKVFIDGQLIQ